MITKDMVVITDVGDSMFGAVDMMIGHANAFISPAYYASMGMAIPASLGVCLAKPEMRPIVLVGDGSFQMSVSEISTLVRRKLKPIIFVLNNRGYTTERFIMDGKFNDVRNWNYHCANMLFGGEGRIAETEEELESAIEFALKGKETCVINVVVGQSDITPALCRVAAAFAKRI